VENRRRITEKDLLVTEALIAASYGQLKQSVVEAPSRALKSAGQTVRDHPYATAATVVVAGVVMYGMYKIMTSRSLVQEVRNNPNLSRQKSSGSMDILQELLPVIMPMVTPYIMGYIQKYLGKIKSGNRD
jgi:hypothetical protein